MKSTTKIIVLIAVQDDKKRQSLGAALSRAGLSCIEAANGYMALQLAAAKLPDAIVISWDIGIYDSANIKSRLAKNADTARIPVIVFGIPKVVHPIRAKNPRRLEENIAEPAGNAEILRAIKNLLAGPTKPQTKTATGPGLATSRCASA